ncbi:thioredoxin-like 3-2, chloroplastic isoform X4 [Carya illinoinensis]|uniref:thioredoxin-like 3-2, chloroplastic isoform X4 n=2 Tax=Carya illinoinensis TaxID=32201 RepID=UPI001C721B98|nr:thioredoxin-like 3-2, chloroplastic isoform X4 [Carya illinoinensis]
MSEVLLRFQVTPRFLRARTPRDFLQQPLTNLVVSGSRTLSLPTKPQVFPAKIDVVGGESSWKLSAWTREGSMQELDDSPVSVELHPICSENQFDRVLAEAQQLEESIIIVWIASWCRKCIYLKPKLEKLAADFYPRIHFYRVDVNTVPHSLVSRAGVTMPTIQLWKDSKKQAELIGSHKAYLVVNEVRQMIENEGTVTCKAALFGQGHVIVWMHCVKGQ